jgi:class 3 adenylate cyclase
MEWQFPPWREWYEVLARKRTLVRYDRRGSGLSERDVTEYSLDVLVLDLEAVVDRLGLERFALLAPTFLGPVAVAYATRHPERVSHLVLWCSHPRGSDVWRSSRAQAFRAIRVTDWEMYTESLADLWLGIRLDEKRRRAFTAFIREAVSWEPYKAFMAAAEGFDVTELLPQVRAPTLVLHRREVVFPEVSVARELASRIPDARLALLEGTSAMPSLGDTDAVLAAIDEFLSEGEEARAAELPEGMAVLLFADIAESTALTEQLGDAAFRGKARELDTSLRSVIRDCGGTPVEGKVLGDGVLAVFTSARQAIDCALRCDAAGEPLGLQLHLGIHAGDVIREGNNVYGGAVNIAARIAGASEPGEVLVSDTVRGLARTSAGVVFDDRGEHTLKGVGELVRLYEVRWREEGA